MPIKVLPTNFQATFEPLNSVIPIFINMLLRIAETMTKEEVSKPEPDKENLAILIVIAAVSARPEIIAV